MLDNTERLELRRKRMAESPAFLRGGFRPFFVGAALWAVFALAAWLAFLFGLFPQTFIDDPLAWHRHEMLFGFIGAAIAGFALTAVPNWTGRLPIAGWPLAALFGVWSAGRILPFVLANENVVLIALDGGFYILLAVLLGREIAKSRNRNLPVVAVIALFGVADLLDRAAIAGNAEIGSLGWRSGLALVIFLISVIGGRIVPSFTRNWLAAHGANEPLPTQPGLLDKLMLVLTSIALLLWLVAPSSLLAGTVLSFAAIGHLFRLFRWQGWRCRSNALLIILHVGYLWVPIGLLLLGLAQLAIVPESSAIHALSTGAAATMILAVMSRASLGHTGRPLEASRITAASYVLVTVAAIARVLVGFVIGEQQTMLAVAGAAWFGAFGLFLLQYVPILCSARNDGTGENKS